MNSKCNNKGFSMIELIVLIALMALVMGAGMGTYSLIKSQRVRELSENVNSAISDVRSKTLTKEGSYELVISHDGSKFVAETFHNGVSLGKKTIGEKGSIRSGSYTVEAGNDIHITFNKTDGSFDVMRIGSVDMDKNLYITCSDRTRTIKLIRATGKHYIDN